MNTIEEYSHLMEMDAAGIETFVDAQGMSERVREWLNTPQATIADKPGWGHNLATLKHEPTSNNLKTMVRILITNKIRYDIRDIILVGIAVEFKDIDIMLLNLDFNFGTVTEEISL